MKHSNFNNFTPLLNNEKEQKTQINKSMPISNKKSIALIFIYLVLYVILAPMLIPKLSTLLEPILNKNTNIILLSFTYLIFFVAVFLLAKQQILQGFTKLKENFIALTARTFKFYLLLFCTTLILNIILLNLIGTSANNQMLINKSLLETPVFTAIITCFFAPIVEETIFREVIYNKLRIFSNEWIAIIISSFLFGLIHISSSIKSGNISDFPYIITYSALGFILVLAYKKSNSIIGSIYLHFVNNSIAILLTFVLLKYLP